MKRRMEHLVVQHAEMMGAQLFDSYQPVLREFLKGRHGVYALYQGPVNDGSQWRKMLSLGGLPWHKYIQ